MVAEVEEHMGVVQGALADLAQEEDSYPPDGKAMIR